MNTLDLYGRSPIRENTRHTHHAHDINLQAAAGMHRKLTVVAHAQEIQHGAVQHQNTKEAHSTKICSMHSTLHMYTAMSHQPWSPLENRISVNL